MTGVICTQGITNGKGESSGTGFSFKTKDREHKRMKTFKLLLVIAALGLLALTASAQTWNTNGLVAYYLFNGNANDASGFGNNGSVNGAILSMSRNGQPFDAYYFNTTNFSIITAPGNSLPTNTQPRTFSFWIKPDPKYPQSSFVTGTILSYGNYSDGLQSYLNYENVSNLVSINLNVFKNSAVSRWGAFVSNSLLKNPWEV